MIQTRLKGMGVALITPFKEDESVDYDALMRLVDYLLQNNADFLCVLGTTAETPTLSEEEKKKIKKMVIDRVNGRIPILLGVGSNNTRAVVETLKNDDFTGVDAILSVVPYYNKPSQEGIYQHYKAIASATELPIVLYNVPGRTGVNMTAETTLRIAKDFQNVIAIKEASGNITQMDDIIKNKPANFVQSRFCTVQAHADFREQSVRGGSLPKPVCQQSNHAHLDRKQGASSSFRLPGLELEPQTAEPWCKDAADDGKVLLLQTARRSGLCG